MRIVDGNHLPASEKRIKPLRDFRGAALPAQSLVVFDPDMGMVVDLLPWEDAHAQERALMAPLLAAAQPGELWMADRNFCTRAILTGWQSRGCAFIVREHGCNPNPTVRGSLVKMGRIDTGMVYEQPVSIDDDAGKPLLLRRIALHLDTPTTDGDTVIRLLTNLPKAQVKAKKVARLYRHRWRIETLFQRLESVLNSEIASLGQPRAALLAYNVLAVLQAAVAVKHKRVAAGEIALSAYYVAAEIRAHYAGMMIAVAAAAWEQYDHLRSGQLARILLQMAGKVDPFTLRKHPRGPKVPKKKGYVPGSVARRHVATARVMQEGRGI